MRRWIEKNRKISCWWLTGMMCWPLMCWGRGEGEGKRTESEVRMFTNLSQDKRVKGCFFVFFLLPVRGKKNKKTGRLTMVSSREGHKKFCVTIVKQEGDQMERCPAGSKEQHHGGHHSYCTLLPPENKRHFYCYRHVNNIIQGCQSNNISFVPVYQDHLIRERQSR